MIATDLPKRDVQNSSIFTDSNESKNATVEEEDESSRGYFAEKSSESNSESMNDSETFESLTADDEISGETLHSSQTHSNEVDVDPTPNTDDEDYIIQDIDHTLDDIYSPTQDLEALHKTPTSSSLSSSTTTTTSSSSSSSSSSSTSSSSSSSSSSYSSSSSSSSFASDSGKSYNLSREFIQTYKKFLKFQSPKCFLICIC